MSEDPNLSSQIPLQTLFTYDQFQTYRSSPIKSMLSTYTIKVVVLTSLENLKNMV